MPHFVAVFSRNARNSAGSAGAHGATVASPGLKGPVGRLLVNDEFVQWQYGVINRIGNPESEHPALTRGREQGGTQWAPSSANMMKAMRPSIM